MTTTTIISKPWRAQPRENKKLEEKDYNKGSHKILFKVKKSKKTLQYLERVRWLAKRCYNMVLSFFLDKYNWNRGISKINHYYILLTCQIKS